MSDEASKLIVAYVVFLIIRFVLKPDPIPQHDSIRTGDMHCRELVASENDNRWRIASRMSRDCFFKFMDALTSARANPAVVVSRCSISFEGMGKAWRKTGK